MRRMVISGIRPGFPGLSQSQGQVAHVLLTRSPLEHPRRGLSARLACVKHAASVRPEPGSNSPTRHNRQPTTTPPTTPQHKPHNNAESITAPQKAQQTRSPKPKTREKQSLKTPSQPTAWRNTEKSARRDTKNQRNPKTPQTPNQPQTPTKAKRPAKSPQCTKGPNALAQKTRC